jgi:hypothetical protein
MKEADPPNLARLLRYRGARHRHHRRHPRHERAAMHHSIT